MSKWSCETTLKFIQEYKTHECLWDFKSAAYRDKHRRDVAYLKLAEAMSLPDFGVAEVKNKIKNLRSTFNQEKKKIADSKKSGTGKNSIYESNVKWLTELEPTMYIGDKRKTFDNLNDEEDGQVGTVGEEETIELITSQAASPASIGATSAPLKTTPCTAPPPKKKTKSLLNAVKDLKDLHAAINADEGVEDCFEAFGHCVATQLRKLSEERALLAQKDIQNILSDYGIQDLRERKKNATSSRMSSSIYSSSSASTSSPYFISSASASPQPHQYHQETQGNDMILYPPSQIATVTNQYTFAESSQQPPHIREQPDSDKLASLVRSSFEC